MSDHKISIDDYDVGQRVPKSGIVSEDEASLSFTVTVKYDGCYTAVVSLIDHDSLSGNDVIATHTSAKLPCFCLQAGQEAKFFVAGAGPSAGNKIAAPKDHHRLPGIRGRWPDNDGPGDNRLEVFASIQLFRCSYGKCDDKNCQPTSQRALIDQYIEINSPRLDVEIFDGNGWDKLAEDGRSVLGTGIGFAGNVSNDDLQFGGQSGEQAALLALRSFDRVNTLERQLTSLGRQQQNIAQRLEEISEKF